MSDIENDAYPEKYTGILLFFSIASFSGVLIDCGGQSFSFSGWQLEKATDPASLQSGTFVKFYADVLPDRVRITRIAIASDVSEQDRLTLQGHLDAREWRHFQKRFKNSNSRRDKYGDENSDAR